MHSLLLNLQSGNLFRSIQEQNQCSVSERELEDKKKWESTHNGSKLSDNEATGVGAGHLAFVFLTAAAEASGFKSV